MRERVLEFLPLLLVGVVLLVFQLSRANPDLFSIQPLFSDQATPTPVVDVVPPVPRPVRKTTPGPSAALTVVICNPAEPRFTGGMAALKSAIGTSMGDPVECELPVNDRGDTNQKTTTGLAYYRRELNVACFTTGWDHWALEERGLVHWSGSAVDPPIDAAVITTR